MVLRCHAFSDAGAQAVAEAVRVNSTLVSLDLSHCGLTDMAGAQIALSLAANRSVCAYVHA